MMGGKAKHRFDYKNTGGMNINMFRIQKKIDVHQLKKSLWNFIMPNIRDSDERRNTTKVNSNSEEAKEDMKMSDILFQMYSTGEIN